MHQKPGGLLLCEHNVLLVGEDFFGADASGLPEKVAERLANGGCRGSVQRAFVVGQASSKRWARTGQVYGQRTDRSSHSGSPR